MRKNKTLEPLSEEFIFYPLTDSKEKHIQLGFGVSKVNKRTHNFLIRITAKFSRHQLMQLLKREYDLVKGALEILPRNPSKAGRKQIVPARLAYTLNKKFGWGPKKIGEFLEVHPETIDHFEINSASIAQAIQVEKKRRQSITMR